MTRVSEATPPPNESDKTSPSKDLMLNIPKRTKVQWVKALLFKGFNAVTSLKNFAAVGIDKASAAISKTAESIDKKAKGIFSKTYHSVAKTTHSMPLQAAEETYRGFFSKKISISKKDLENYTSKTLSCGPNAPLPNDTNKGGAVRALGFYLKSFNLEISEENGTCKLVKKEENSTGDVFISLSDSAIDMLSGLLHNVLNGGIPEDSLTSRIHKSVDATLKAHCSSKEQKIIYETLGTQRGAFLPKTVTNQIKIPKSDHWKSITIDEKIESFQDKQTWATQFCEDTKTILPLKHTRTSSCKKENQLQSTAMNLHTHTATVTVSHKNSPEVEALLEKAERIINLTYEKKPSCYQRLKAIEKYNRHEKYSKAKPIVQKLNEILTKAKTDLENALNDKNELKHPDGRDLPMNSEMAMESLKIEIPLQTKKTVSMIRGGAPCTHGMEKTEKLFSQTEKLLGIPKDAKQSPYQRFITLKQHLKSKDPSIPDKDFEESNKLVKQIDDKIHLSTAQMASRLEASYKMRPPEAGKSFIHSEMSYLSPGNSKERSMLMDAEMAMEYLSQNYVIVKDPEGNTTLQLSANAEHFPKGSTSNKIQIILSQFAVNENQISDNHMQERINLKACQDLKDLIESSQLDNHTKGLALKNLQDIEKYTKSPDREYADIRIMNNFNEVYSMLGITQGIFCKSGKDRTGQGAGNIISEEIGRVTGTAFHSNPDASKALKENVRVSLYKGLSWYITGANTGKRNGYAFNEFQLKMLPESMRTESAYCNTSAQT